MPAKTSTKATDSYTISQLADEFSVTTRTLRFYEEKGLLSPTRTGQTRHYSPADRTRLRLILRGKRLGLTLDESAEIILMYDPQAGNKKQIKTLIDKIQHKRDQLKQQQRDLKLMLADLDKATTLCEQALNGTR